nr:hypothetical protein [Tanacetum cinerariifolium]
MSLPASPEHVLAIPDQLPVELTLATNPPEHDNDYLNAVDYDDEEEPYEVLDDEEEDPKEDPEMDLDKEEEDPEMDVDDKDKDVPLFASPPPLSSLRTPPHVLDPLLIQIFLLPLLPLWIRAKPVKAGLWKLGSHDQSLTRGMGTRRTEIDEAHKEAIRARRCLDKFMWVL